MVKQHRYTVHSTDDAGTAVLERDDGISFPVPVDWLPEGAQPGQMFDATFETSSTEMTIRLMITEGNE